MRNNKIAAKDVNAERAVTGQWICSVIHNNLYIHRAYFFYTKREAIRLFVEYVNTQGD